MKKYIALGILLMLSLVLAACGGGSGGDASGNRTTGSSEAFPVLHWASIQVPRADPVTKSGFSTFSLVAPVEQSLMSFDKEGKVVPGLASSVSNPNPTTYIYHLKSGVRFSDGKPMTAEDVLFSLKRNFEEESLLATTWEDVKSITKQGADEIVIKLKKPEVAWPGIPAFSGWILEKAAAVKGGIEKIGTPSNLPIGTGPYKFASFNPQTGATLVLNPYWNGPKPTAEKIDVKFYKEDAQTALAIRSGEADGTSFAQSKNDFEFPGAEVLSTPGVGEMAIGMNTQVAPFNDVHVRKAIAYATDRKGMIEAIFRGEAELSQTLTPPTLYANIAPAAQVESTFAKLPSYEFDLAKAKEELQKSKYPNGFTATFPAEPAALKTVQILAPDLAKIGIHLKIEQLTEAAYYEIALGPRDKIGFTFNWYSATFPDPGALLDYFLSPAEAKVNGLNSANYTNPEVGELLEQQSQASNGAERLGLINEIFQIEREEVPYIPLFTPDQYMVLSTNFVMEEYSPWTISFTPWPLLIKKAS